MKKITIFLALVLLVTNLLNAQKKPVTPNTKETPKPVVNKVPQILIPKVQATAEILKPEPEKITLNNITEWLCPQILNRGDREFDGHGPRVKCNVTISLQNNNTEIWAKINFEAKETVHDWSTTTASWDVKVYTTPYGKKIDKILSDVYSRTEFISPAAGFQFLVPGSDIQNGLSVFFDGQVISSAILAAHGIPVDATPAIIAQLVKTYVKGNQIIQTPALEGGLVSFFHIVGDTGGDDISSDDNCNDDTRIEKIEFFPVRVILVNV